MKKLWKSKNGLTTVIFIEPDDACVHISCTGVCHNGCAIVQDTLGSFYSAPLSELEEFQTN